MRTTTNIVRVVFLILAMVAYARPSFAGYPMWWPSCTTTCLGPILRMQCEFFDNADQWDEFSGCEDNWEEPNHTSCCVGPLGEFGDAYREAYARYYQGCQDAAGGAGASFYSFSCSENATRGNFTCSYEDLVSCGS